MEKSKNHFKIEGYSRQAIHDTINRMQIGGKINDKKKTGPKQPPGHLPERIS